MFGFTNYSFNPISTNPVAWYDAFSLNIPDGSGISSWYDKSHNGNTVIQNSAGGQPIYKTGIINGKPIARFGGSQWMENSTNLPSGNNAWSYVVIFQYNASDTDIFGWGNNSFYGRVGALANWTVHNTYGTEVCAKIRYGGPQIPAATPAFAIATYNGTDISTGYNQYINGTGFATSGDNGSMAIPSSPTISIGALPSLGGSNFTNADTAEILIFDRELTPGQISLLAIYIKSKYGI